MPVLKRAYLLNRVFKAFAYPDFRLMWFGACTSSIGTWMQIAAQSWLVYNITNRPVFLTLDAFFGQAPIFFCRCLAECSPTGSAGESYCWFRK